MKKKSDFQIQLNFQAHPSWPASVPAVALSGTLICGFNLPPDHPVFEHPVTSRDENTKLFVSLYPELNLSELAHLVNHPAAPSLLNFEFLFSLYSLHDSQDLRDVLSVVLKTSTQFQEWLGLKKIGYYELLPLVGLETDKIQKLTENLISFSKNDGVNRLEMLSDLCKMGQNLDPLLSLSQNDLKNRRFPQTFSRDQQTKQAELPWASNVRKNFSRRGDKGGFEVQFFAGTPAELNKVAQNLMKVAQEWNLNTPLNPDKNS